MQAESSSSSRHKKIGALRSSSALVVAVALAVVVLPGSAQAALVETHAVAPHAVTAHVATPPAATAPVTVPSPVPSSPAPNPGQAGQPLGVSECGDNCQVQDAQDAARAAWSTRQREMNSSVNKTDETMSPDAISGPDLRAPGTEEPEPPDGTEPAGVTEQAIESVTSLLPELLGPSSAEPTTTAGSPVDRMYSEVTDELLCPSNGYQGINGGIEDTHGGSSACF